MTASELLVKTVENFLEHVDYCFDQMEKKGVCEFRMDEWYIKLNASVDEVYREDQGLPPKPITGRPRGSKDRWKRRPRRR